MSAGVRSTAAKGFKMASQARRQQPSASLVQLSKLRKLCECEQVAAVCYRVRSGGIEFLLVRTRGGGRWTFPKGSAEPGLSHAQAAALEAFEEAGVHGRIEDTSFARYVRRERRGGRRSAAGSGNVELAISAHLCEVSRLSPPKESRRNRTWFSVTEARLCLREGRDRDDGAELARVVARAVARIQRLRGRIGGDQRQDDRQRDDRPQQDQASQKDALRRVQFEACAEAGGMEASMQNIRRQLSRMRQFAVPIVDAHPPELLRGEVLQFDPDKKAKALGNGANLRG